MSTLKQERLPQLDIFRAIAILGVIHVHSSSFAAAEQGLNSPYYYWLNWINIFFKFGTPSFIFLSSFVLFYNYYGRPVTRSLIGNFYRRRMTYILLPYLLASMGYYGLKLYVNGEFASESAIDNLLSFLRALFTGSAYAHLYFVFISIQFYIFFPLILKLLQSSRIWVRLAIPLGFGLQWGFIFLNKYQLHIIEKGSLAISYLAYYMMGAFVAIHFDKVKQWLTTPWGQMSSLYKKLTVLLLSCWLVAAFTHVQLWYNGRHDGIWVNSLWYELLWNLHTMLSALSLMYFAFLIYRSAPRAVVAWLTRLGELSFAVYLIHPLVLLIYRRFRYHIPLESFTYVMFVYGGLVAALTISWLLTQFVFRRFRLSWVIFGSVPRSLSPASRGTKGTESNGAVNSPANQRKQENRGM
ncbi:acyltransferase [Paenibacillus donghaensis]|uniref:Acyltransferase n=1 Tax=Paenibacillus donghaensis TaxID=414771 RepID=A0A2Z2KG17_9BACL|nr:acyltransferase [Paenibacillus donghaensis]ASA25104.1 acyltransferase [Paenibacillus donghaensis]